MAGWWVGGKIVSGRWSMVLIKLVSGKEFLDTQRIRDCKDTLNTDVS